MVNISKKLLLASLAAVLMLTSCDQVNSWLQPKDESPFVKEVAPAKDDGQVAMLLPDFTLLVEREGLAVVNIQALREGMTERRIAPQNSPFPEDDPFYDFFKKLIPNNPEYQLPEDNSNALSYGSGFLISDDGYILTNAHVVNGASQIKVMLGDKREFSAKLVGLDKQTDVAVLKIEATNLPVVKIGSPAALKVGEWVAAIGAPFGFDNSVTAGIVSAKGRSLPNESYTPFIQTDVAINPGNSGGPLFNLKGQVIGINSQIYSRSGGFMGISFAIPIDIAMNVANQIKATGKVRRGQLGVLIQEVTYDLGQSFGLEKPYGALIAKITPGSAAEKAAIKVGDIIIRVNGKKVESSKDLPMMIGAIPPGEKITLGIWRKHKEIEASVQLGEVMTAQATPESKAPAENTYKQGFELPALGLTLATLSDQIKEQTKLNTGVLVLRAQGAAARSGLIAGDIILSVGQSEVMDEASFKAAINKEEGSVALLIRRGEDAIFLPLKIR